MFFMLSKRRLKKRIKMILILLKLDTKQCGESQVRFKLDEVDTLLLSSPHQAKQVNL
jgi:hypothetical protein